MKTSNNGILHKKMVSGEIDKNLLLKSIIEFNLNFIIPIIYENSSEKSYDKISEKEAKLEFLNNSI